MAVPPSAALRCLSLRCGVWEEKWKEKLEMNRDLGDVNAMYGSHTDLNFNTQK